MRHKENKTSKIRKFDTGAFRDTEEGKLDIEGFINPLVIKSFCEYMHKHRFIADKTLRNSDDWQKGIPQDVYIKSLSRHYLDLWLEHRGYKSREGKIDALNGILFNVMGYYLEELKK